jgi:hypothetical protein
MAAPERNYELKKSQLFVTFPFVSIISNLLSAENQVFFFFFNLKCSFRGPFYSAARGCRTTRPILASPLVTRIADLRTGRSG